MIAWVRTQVYRAVFYTVSAGIVITAPVALLFGQRALIAHAHEWARFHGWAVRVLLGISVRVEGVRPPGQALYASKHQAFFETTELAALLDDPAVVFKRELKRIPLWGWAIQRYGGIVVDRDASSTALRAMMRAATAVRASGRSVLIYPEGTRVLPGEQPPLKSGFAGLYRALGLPVVPIAVNSGLLMPKRGAKRPGVVTLRFGEPIPAGLKRAEIEARTHAAINALERQPEPHSPAPTAGSPPAP